MSDSQLLPWQNDNTGFFAGDDWFRYDDLEVEFIDENNQPCQSPGAVFIARQLSTDDIGQNSLAWTEIMKNFHSKKTYTERIEDFVDYITANRSDLTLEQKLNNYFQARMSEKNEEETDKYRATTLRSWLSVFSKFWKFVRLSDLKILAPQLEANIATREKQQQKVKQAKVFKKEELSRYYNMPHTPDNLGDMAYSVVGLSFGGRGAEIIKVQFEDVTRTVNPDTGETKILIKYQRTKQAGVPEMSEAMITGKLEVDILIAYESKFPKTERTGRYFRKLIATSDGLGIKGTKINIGHNVTAKTGVRIATKLGLNNPELYTGHTFRRTCATICAEGGMQLAAIKQITGHRSDTVAQRYIDHSDHMKQGGADVLSLGGLQKAEDGSILRKRPFAEMTTHNSQNNATTSSSNSHRGTVINISFNNCHDVTYNASA